MLQHIQFGLTVVKKGQREPYLAGLLKGRKIPQALIFCGRRKEIYGITGFLRNCGYKAEAYYGDQEQNERENILARFKEGHIDYLVASDLAARGLDIERLPAVINLSIPTEFDFYLHRVGRTGRAGNKGMVFNIIASNIEATRLKSHHRAIELPLHEVLITPLDLSTLDVDFHEKWVKYHLSRGKRDKVRKGDIVGFLSNNTSLTADEMGTITIYDSYSIVDLAQKGFKELMETETPLKLKGKSVKIRKYQVDEQEKRAISVKKLKKDRR
ncbi:UNVERIFIED_CONTAM: hypothetical protein GTU68_007553 [Idotea baltica]|nr:hypothetical protein [Idotea baltica]